MRKPNFKSFSFLLLVRLAALPTFAAGVALFSILQNGETNQPVLPENAPETFEVRFLPAYNEKSSKEERFWQYQKFLNPATEIPDPIPAGLPNYCGDLSVFVNEKGQITLNSEENGSVENTDVLRRTLEEIFRSRAEAGVYRVDSNDIVKHVLIKADSATSYDNLIKVVEAAKASGADPVILQTEK